MDNQEKMTLDDAITHAREIAEKNKRAIKFESEDSVDDDIKINCLNCAKQHEQLAEWLEELKALRITVSELQCELQATGALLKERDEESRNNAIDDFASKLIMHFADWELSNAPFNDETDRTGEIICETIENAIGGVEEIAEQLKKGE